MVFCCGTITKEIAEACPLLPNPSATATSRWWPYVVLARDLPKQVRLASEPIHANDAIEV